MASFFRSISMSKPSKSASTNSPGTSNRSNPSGNLDGRPAHEKSRRLSSSLNPFNRFKEPPPPYSSGDPSAIQQARSPPPQGPSYQLSQSTYQPPQNTYQPPQNTYQPPQNTYQSPQNTYQPPQNTYQPPQNTFPGPSGYGPAPNGYTNLGAYGPAPNAYPAPDAYPASGAPDAYPPSGESWAYTSSEAYGANYLAPGAYPGTEYSGHGSQQNTGAPSNPFQPPPNQSGYQPTLAPETGDILNDPRCKLLAHFDTLFLIDDSGSMAGRNWRETEMALSKIVPVCARQDEDGVDIYFLNSKKKGTKIKEPAEVSRLFNSVRPDGTTPTGARIATIMQHYLRDFRINRKIKPLNIICITDGEPSDPTRLDNAIIDCARELDRLDAKERQLGIQFIQVGSDPQAADALEELDNAMSETYGIRDMVDTVSFNRMDKTGFNGEAILKCVLGAITKEWDVKFRLK